MIILVELPHSQVLGITQASLNYCTAQAGLTFFKTLADSVLFDFFLQNSGILEYFSKILGQTS